MSSVFNHDSAVKDNGQDNEISPKQQISVFKGALFLGAVATGSILGGVALTVGKHKSGAGGKGNSAVAQADGARLAMKALGYGTLLSVSGFSIMIFTIKKLFNINSMEDFDTKMKTIVPQKDTKAFESLSFMRVTRKDENSNDESKLSGES